MENTIDNTVALEEIGNLVDKKINELKEWGQDAKETLIKIEALCEIYRKLNKGF